MFRKILSIGGIQHIQRWKVLLNIDKYDYIVGFNETSTSSSSSSSLEKIKEHE